MFTRFFCAALLAWPCFSAVATPLTIDKASAAAVATPLTIDEAAAAALRNQPLIDAQQAAVDAALQSAVSEGQLPDPRLKVGNINDGPGNFGLTRDFGERSIAIEQAFPREKKRQLKSERAKLESEVGRSVLENLRRTIPRDAKLAWLNLCYPLHAAVLVKDSLRYYDQQRETLEIALRVGKARLAEVSRMQVETDLQKDRLAEFEGQAAKARVELVRWVGIAAERELPESLPELPPPAPLKDLRARLEQHPMNTAVLGEIALAGNDVAQARAAYQSDWSVEIAYHKRGSAFTDLVSVQVGIDLPLFTANRQDRSLAAREALRAKADSAHIDHLRRITADLQSAYAEWQSTRDRLERFDHDVLPQAARRVEAALAAYRGAQGDLLNVLEARRAELDLRLQRLALAVATLKSQTQLAYFAE